MNKLSTQQVAKKLGMSKATLSRYILMGKVPAPPESMVAGIRLRLWSESAIQLLREALPKAKNGRKIRYQKLREKEQTPARASGPHKLRKHKKK